MVRIVMSKNRKASAQVELFKTWLSRSGDSPLSISLRSFSGTYVLSHFLQSQFAIFSPRLEYLDLAIPCDAMYMVRSHMPLLRHLELTLTSIPFWGLDALTPFDRSPLLTHIVLERFYNQFILQLPWTQFTHLEVQYLTLAECAEILCDAIRLVHCTFGIRPSDQRMDIPLVPPHDRLQHLVLRPGLNQSQDRDLWRLFDRLTLPALRTLEVFDFGLNPDSLEAFISRSRCSLHQLHVTEGNGMLSEILDDERLPSVGRDVLEGSGLEVYS
ncbi:hypothetical protein B0H16DRAFT_1638064 [Mycena metata]|uniref:Uncharacterized protein n=1 Tax=Mycena metata TaxID=1033252 RepID=A0AAD7GSD6_9AGAR|nr:hypothetical protein B0H16DRAFT_1638064 [Mycena metata]